MPGVYKVDIIKPKEVQIMNGREEDWQLSLEREVHNEH